MDSDVASLRDLTSGYEYLTDVSRLDQLAAVIAALAEPGMDPADALSYFDKFVSSASNAEHAPIKEQMHALGFYSYDHFVDALTPLIAHHGRQLWEKGILSRPLTTCH